MRKRTVHVVLLGLLILSATAWPISVWAQDDPPPFETPIEEGQPEAPAQVNVDPAQDEQIAERLTRILQATEWFIAPQVEVRDGVVFLDGRTRREERREWAGNLARNTQDVVAVVNRIEVIPRPAWDFSPAVAELWALWRGTIQSIPVIVFGAIVLVLAWWLARLIAHFMRPILSTRFGSPLLTSIVLRAIAIPIFLLGIYLVLQVAGLTRLAVTLLGGTGIVGIIVGFAFRDIAENFLSSVLLSIQRPFRSKDLIEVSGHLGIVQQMNTRSTILMTLDGNHVQIPNSTIFKSTIINYTANANRRSEFTVGIGYEDSIQQAQEIVAQVLADHPAVLETPEPLVLAETLGASTVNLRIYFWCDAMQYSPLKIKSSIIRLTKRALTEAGVSMPDEAREVIFPRGVPLVSVPQETEAARPPLKRPNGQPAAPADQPEPVSTAAEGDLRSEDVEMRKQAEHSRLPEGGENLLEKDS